MVAVLAAVGVGLLAGCSGGHSAARRTPPVDSHMPRPPQTPAQARSVIAHIRTEWLQEITSRGARAKRNEAPARFASPSRAVFLARLQHASARYHFAIGGVRFYHPFQLAPFVVVRSDDPKQFSRDTRHIVDSLDVADQHAPFRNRYWQYEGFYLEARDRAGVPFLAVSNFIRGEGWGGGQWARSDDLYPFLHG